MCAFLTEPRSSLLNRTSQRGNLNPIRVLLVDDHALVRAGIRALIDLIPNLEVIGEAGNGPEALLLVEELQPDVVLLDITMPGINGLQTLEQFGARFPQVRVIILTMHEAREYAIQALRAGAAGFIPKSAASAELKVAIETVMRGKTFVSKETAQDSQFLDNKQADERKRLEALTPRQREILVLIAEGKGTKEIARTLDISVKTVESHRAQLAQRLDIHDVAGLVRFAIKTNLIKVE